MRTRKYKINIELYGAIINLYVTDNPQRVKGNISGEKEIIYKDANKDGNADAFFLYNDPDNKEYDIILSPSAGPYLISHEALHVTLAIAGACGLMVSSENDEPITYLHSHIVDEIAKRI